MSKPKPEFPPLSAELELKRLVPLSKASEISTLSTDTLRRRHADKIVNLSPRRQAMRLGDALMLNNKTA